ncbi:MAG: lactate utilization protein [Hyphomicrobiales bacterium]|nr:lactate utilization protein [Hyphomicrobiales bacterium]
MSARDDVFANIRRSLGVTGKEATRRGIVAQRLQEPSRGPIPARGQGSPANRMATFLTEAQRVSASVVVLNSAADVPGEVARWLRDANLPLQVRIGADVRLTQLDWHGAAMEVRDGASAGADLSAVSHAFAGVAETGSLVVLSGPDNPVTLNFLPDNHIVVLSAADLFGDLESVWAKLRRDHGKGVMPRTVNIITGPSRSADIEQTLLLGAHGPRSLHILITLA